MTRVRPATPTVACIDQDCAHYRALFDNVRERFATGEEGVRCSETAACPCGQEASYGTCRIR
jgi:hypothetical protein